MHDSEEFIAAGNVRKPQSRGEDKCQRSTFFCVGATEANGEYIWKWKWDKKCVCFITTSMFIVLPFAFHICSLFFPLQLSFSISLWILPPSSYDPRVIHKGKAIRLGLNLNSDPLVSSGSKHTRTFIYGMCAPVCIIVVILNLSTVT